MILSIRVRAATVAACLQAVLPLFAHAAESEPTPVESRVTAASAAEEALRASPDLAAAYAAIDAARGRLLQAGLWPNPALTLAGRSDFAFRNEGERVLGVDLAQRFPIAGRLARAQEVARVDVALALAEAREFERALIGDVQRTVYGLVALDLAIASRASVIRTAEQLVHAATRRRQAAEVSDADVNLLEIELARFEQEKRRLELDRGVAAVRLNQLLFRRANSPVEVSTKLDESAFDASQTAEELAKAGARRPDLEGLRLESDRARAEAQLARAESWEDWTVGAGYESDRQVFRNEPSVDPIGTKQDEFLGLALNVPLPLWNRNQGRVAEAHANERRARARLAARERAVEAEIEAARRRATELSRVAREYEESLLPRAQRNVELLERAYRQGLVAITTLVQAEQQLADTVLRRAETLGELRQAEVDLETAAAASPLLRTNPTPEENRP
jgi:cobalt-zinc-cadmium efflux system outer membrane protein